MPCLGLGVVLVLVLWKVSGTLEIEGLGLVVASSICLICLVPWAEGARRYRPEWPRIQVHIHRQGEGGDGLPSRDLRPLYLPRLPSDHGYPQGLRRLLASASERRADPVRPGVLGAL